MRCVCSVDTLTATRTNLKGTTVVMLGSLIFSLVLIFGGGKTALLVLSSVEAPKTYAMLAYYLSVWK